MQQRLCHAQRLVLLKASPLDLIAPKAFKEHVECPYGLAQVQVL